MAENSTPIRSGDTPARADDTPIRADDTNVDIDLSKLFSAIWRNGFKLAIAVLIAGGLAFAFVSVVDPKYRSEASISIESREPVFSDQTQNGPSPSSVFDERGITSQVELLRSSDLITQVAKDLDLASYSEFDAPKSPSFLASIAITLGLMTNPYTIPAEERVLKEFYERLDVYVSPQTRVIKIEFSSENPELAAKVPNAMADMFLKMQSGTKISNNSEASVWLAQEIEVLRGKVRDAEARIADYRAEKGLFLVGENDTLNTLQLSEISAELTRIRSERVDAEARSKTVRRVLDNGQDVDSIANVLESATIQRLRENEATTRADIADLSTTLLDGHPRMQALRSQLIDIQNQIRSETRKVLASLENEASVAKLREQELTASLNALKADSASAGGEEVQLRALEREAAAQRDLLETYLSRYREASSRVQAAAVPPDARIFSRAIVPTEAYFPKKLPIIIVSMLATFIMGAIIIILAELFSGRALRSASGRSQSAHTTSPHAQDLRPSLSPDMMKAMAQQQVASSEPVNIIDSRANIEQEQANSLLSSVTPAPAVKTQNMAKSASIIEVAAELLIARTRLIFCMSPQGDQTALGSLKLARLMAEGNAETLLLDLTLSGAPTAHATGTTRMTGLTNLLSDDICVSETIHPDTKTKAHILARGTGNVQRAMANADQIPTIINALYDSYDAVIVECGAVSFENMLQLTETLRGEFVISHADMPQSELKALHDNFEAHGYNDVITMDVFAHERTSKSDQSNKVA